MVIHFVEIFLHNIKYNWLIRFSKTTRRVMAIHIASLSLIARGKQQIRSVITITSKPGTRDPIVQNAKTRDRVPASPSRSQPIPGFSSPPEWLCMLEIRLIMDEKQILTIKKFLFIYFTATSIVTTRPFPSFRRGVPIAVNS